MTERIRITAAALLLPDGQLISRPPPARHHTLMLDAEVKEGLAHA